MISQERFNENELEHGCGYWNMCWEHACPCAITTENKGLTEKIYNDFCEENRRLAEEFDNEEWDYIFNEDVEEDEYPYDNEDDFIWEEE